MAKPVDQLVALVSREQPGLETLEDRVPSCELKTLRQALEEEHDYDAYAVQYVVVDANGRLPGEDNPMPRLRKTGAGAVRSAGWQVLVTSLWVDCDLPNHKPWDHESFEAVTALLTQLQVRDPEIMNSWSAFYTTRNGFRFCYVLKEPLSPEHAEHYSRGLVARFQKLGLADYVDTSVCDWTRLFRLPRVLRDGAKTSSDFYHVLLLQEDAVLDVKAVVQPIYATASAAVRQSLATEPVNEGDRPTVDEAKNLLCVVDANGRSVKTEWYRSAIRRLKANVGYVHSRITLTETIGSFTQGRNNSLTKLLASTMSCLMWVPGTNHKLIYAIWIDAIEQMMAKEGATDGNGKSWFDVAWEYICRYWPQREAERKLKEEQVSQDAAPPDQGLTDRILHGVRQWGPPEILGRDDTSALEWVARHAIVILPDGYSVLTPSGYYDAHVVSLTNMPARIRELGMSAIIPIEESSMGPRGLETRSILARELLLRHGTYVVSREGVVSTPGSYIRDVGTDSATFCVKLFDRREDLIPTYHEGVDEWMKVTFGIYYDLVCRWIAYAIAFDEGPICALSINAPQGIGKKLLAEGLAETITTQTIASGKELVGRFQSQILKTPFLVVDEGLPRVHEGMDPADAFRSLVSGDTIHVEEKGKGVISVHNPMRILITANNDSVVKSLYHHRTLSANDRGALALRMCHIELDNSGAEFLRRRGGLDYTGRKGQLWIRGDSGKKSDFIVAKHFLWLWVNRAKWAHVKGSRLLVEGGLDSSLIAEMAISSGSSPEVIEAVISMIESSISVDGLYIEKETNDIFVTAASVRDQCQKLASVKGSKFNLAQSTILPVLEALCSTSSAHNVEKNLDGKGLKKWWRVDKILLMSHALRNGVSCEKLRTLARKSATEVNK